MITTFDLLRHGEPVGGRKYRGQIDDPLSDKGWDEMDRALGGACPWTQVVSSPLVRCQAFAQALAERHGLPFDVEARLREVGFGVWEGRTAAEIETVFPGALARFKADPLTSRPEGAEPLEDFHARVAAALEATRVRHAGQHVLIVCHAGVIRMALAWALDMPLRQAYRIEVASASVTRLRFVADRASLIFHGGCVSGICAAG